MQNLRIIYAGTTLKIPVRITNADHRPAPLQTILCDFSHSPGVAKITGTATTNANDTITNRPTKNWRIPIMRIVYAKLNKFKLY